MPVAIVSDTCHYLPRELVTEQDIHEVSLYVHWPEGAERESEITDYDAYYRRLATESELPTTSQPSIGDFLAVYEPLLEAGNEIVSIHLAGGMSGTVRSAEQAREQLGDGRRPSTCSTPPPPAAVRDWSCSPRRLRRAAARDRRSPSVRSGRERS